MRHQELYDAMGGGEYEEVVDAMIGYLEIGFDSIRLNRNQMQMKENEIKNCK